MSNGIQHYKRTTPQKRLHSHNKQNKASPMSEYTIKARIIRK